MTRPVRVALAQLRTQAYDVDINRQRTEEALECAFAARAELVVMPELVTSGYALDPERLRAVAEPLLGPTVHSWTRAAAQAGGYVVGGLCELAGDALYNSAVVVGPDGIVAHYRKLHLFDRERRVFCPGDLGLPVVDTAVGRLGVCVCYDLRFVEVLRILALRGAEVVCVPTAWVAGFDHKPSGRVCAQAEGALLQANLNQVYVACASQAGKNDEFRFLGNSVLADPYGRALRSPLPADAEEVLVDLIHLDRAAEAQVRGEHIRPRADRRLDVYGVAYENELY